jgi:hypothetical protein
VPFVGDVCPTDSTQQLLREIRHALKTPPTTKVRDFILRDQLTLSHIAQSKVGLLV